MVAVIGGVDDDGVLGQALRLEGLEESADCIVDSAHHAQVGPHVGAVLGLCIPAPEKALAVDRGLEETGLALKDLGIVQSGRGNLVLLVQAIDRPGPGKVPNAGPTVTILGMAGIEPHVESEGLVLGLVLEKLNTTIYNQLGFMPQGTIRLLLVERVPTNPLKDIKVVGRIPTLGHLGVPFARKTGPVTGFSKEINIEFHDRLRTGGVMSARCPITASGKPSQDSGSTHPTNSLAYIGIGESCASSSQLVDVRRLG